MLSTAEMSGLTRRGLSWKLDSSSTMMSSGVTSSTFSTSASPILPPTSTRRRGMWTAAW